MKKLGEQKWMLIVYAVLLITIGLIEFILSIVRLDIAVQVMSYSIAAGLFIVGLMHIIVSLIADTKAFFRASLILGCIAIAIGVVLCIAPSLLEGFVVLFVAILSIALGAVLIVKAILAIIYKYKGLWIFLYFLFATICITFGILALVFGSKNQIPAQIIFASTGAFILAVGIFLLIAAIRVMSAKKEPEKVE